MTTPKQNSWMKLLRIVAIMEGISYLLFAITMPLKYYGELLWPNKYVGMAHGVLFIAYVILVLIVWTKKKWKLEFAFYALYASLIPLGTFIVDKYLFKENRIK
jgi:integral membrane protein